MGVGRFLCVALPFALTAASLVAIMITMLAGITDKSLYMLDVDVKNMSISTSALINFSKVVKREPEPVAIPGVSDLTVAGLSPNYGTNITAKTLDLADSYRISLWNYCRTTGTNTTCTKAKFDWASGAANITEINQTLQTATSYSNVTIPKDIKAAITTFQHVNKWTGVVYIIAIILTVLELIFGVVAIFSRIGSCCTYIMSGFSTTAIICASIMATAESSIATGAIKTVAKIYGVQAHMNTRFLATTWIAVAFSIASGFFWLFTICCCAAEHKKNRRSHGGDREKLIPTGAYQRVQDPEHHGQQSGVYAPHSVPMQHFKPQQQRTGNGAYEPYSHTAI